MSIRLVNLSSDPFRGIAPTFGDVSKIWNVVAHLTILVRDAGRLITRNLTSNITVSCQGKLFPQGMASSPCFKFGVKAKTSGLREDDIFPKHLH